MRSVQKRKETGFDALDNGCIQVFLTYNNFCVGGGKISFQLSYSG